MNLELRFHPMDLSLILYRLAKQKCRGELDSVGRLKFEIAHRLWSYKPTRRERVQMAEVDYNFRQTIKRLGRIANEAKI